MMTFKTAMKRHAMLRGPVQNHGAEALASEFWDAVTRSQADSPAAIAVEDTTPTEYAVLLTVEDIPAAFAVACHVRAFGANPPSDPHRCRELARRGWDEFRKIADAAGDRQRGTGCDLSDAWPLFKQFQDAPIDQDHLRRISDLAGRMIVALKGALEKRVVDVPDEVKGVKLGNQFDQLVPAEYARLANPVLRTELIGRVVRHRANVLEREGEEQKARGPMVFLSDESGSMEGQEDVWAKAAMTALTRLAWEDKRPCACVHFSTATKVHKLLPGDHRALVRAQTLFLDGGTDTGRAITVGLDTVAELAKEGITGADLVLISDGRVPDSQVTGPLDRMEREGVRLWSIDIGGHFREGSPLRTRASGYQVVDHSSLNDANGVTAIADATGR